MKLKIIISSIVLVINILGLGFLSSANAVTENQPNLTPFPAYELQLQTVGASTLLRFSTKSWNNGAGPAEFIAGSIDKVNGKQEVFQRIYSSDGSSRDVFAGSFVWHEAHNHFHFEDYALYTLQPVSAPGASERIGQKTTFCIMDTTRVNTKIPGASKHARYTTCNAIKQGMSVGWGDRYGYSLAGQSIDVTDLPGGDYNLKIEVDPKGKIVESNETDNVSNVLIRIANGAVSVI